MIAGKQDMHSLFIDPPPPPPNSQQSKCFHILAHV